MKSNTVVATMVAAFVSACALGTAEAADSPKLMDAWPKEGPPVLWTSDLVPGFWLGGCGGPVVADGRIYVYSQEKIPVGGGSKWRLVTAEALANAGWMPGLPDDLAKKIEDAWASSNRPRVRGWDWLAFRDQKTRDKDLSDFLAKNPELDKYIQDFLATLPANDAEKYGSFVRNRLCIAANGMPWDQLVRFSKLKDQERTSFIEWAGELGKIREETGHGNLMHHLGMSGYLRAWWQHSYTNFQDSIYCLDAATGKILWEKTFSLTADEVSRIKQEPGNWCNGPYIDCGEYLGVSSRPTIWNGRCYFTGAAGLYCVSAKDGKLIWQVKREPLHPSVLVAQGIVYHCGTAYDAETGKCLWKNPLWKGIPTWQKGGDNGSPQLCLPGGRPRIVAPDGRGNYSFLDLETGKEAYSLPRIQNTNTGGPIISGDILMQKFKQFKITPTALEQLPPLKGKIGEAYGVVSEGFYYAFIAGCGDDRSPMQGMCCFDLKTGELKWRDASELHPAILSDGKIIAVKSDGNAEPWCWQELELIKATPDKFVSLGRFGLNMCPWSNPMALVDGKLFVRHEQGITCYDLRAR